MKYALEEFMPQMNSSLGFAALRDLIPSHGFMYHPEGCLLLLLDTC